MTILSATPVDPDQLDLLDAIADNETPLGSLHAADFRTACEAVADSEGWVNPNLVSAWLHARWGEINPRWYSAQWAPACGPKGFMDKTTRPVQIDPARSKGNGNKATVYRRLRGPRGGAGAQVDRHRPAQEGAS